MDALVGWLLGLSGLATCLLALACTVLINDRRTYYPLLKLIFGTVAGVTGATAAASLWGTEGAPSLRVWGSGALLAAMAWSAWFVRRRNRFPAYILVDLRGVPLEIDPDQLEVSAVATLSLIRHGAATPELVERAREAVAEYDRLTAWKHELARQAAARSGKRTKEQGQ